jgi:hypothetical protein
MIGHAASCTMRSISCKALVDASCTITKAIGPLRRRDPRDVEKGRHACDDVMTQRGYGPCDLVEANPWPVGDRDAEDALGSHSPPVRCIRPFADSAALGPQGEQQMRLWISFQRG